MSDTNPLDFSEILFLDGAMGTEIQKKILPKAAIPEEYNLIAPKAIEDIYESYIDAGSQIIMANTFGASSFHLDPLGLDQKAIITAAIQSAKKAASKTGAKVALDLGPTGQLLQPAGSLSFEEAYNSYADMVRIGSEAGADLIAIETMSDLHEVKAALLAAKENSDLPVFVSMTFEENGRTFAGASLECLVTLAESLKADALGINCSLGPKQLAPLLKKLASLTSLPVIAKPNAGLPDPKDGSYHLSDDEFAAAAREYVEGGISIIGGCCGTTPKTIARLKQEFAGKKVQKQEVKPVSRLCSGTRSLDLDAIRVVGERINPTGKKRMQKALLENDLDYIARLVLEQQEAGADILDVNVGHPGVDEAVMLPKVIEKIQSVCDLPLLLDSSDPKALEAGLRAVNGVAAINSVNGKQESLDAILPLAAKYGSPVVALCLDENGIPKTAQRRLAIAEKILKEAAKYGISKENLWFDALTLTVSAQQNQARETLKAIETISRDWKAPTILGVSNISFGLPERMQMTRTFLNAALQAGLRFAIINPSSAELMDTIAAFKVLSMEDEGCKAYIERFASAEPAVAQKTEAKKEMSLQEAIEKGLEHEAAQAAKTLLKEGADELAITENELIPALDAVGKGYEEGRLYLPNLLQAAASAQAVFEVIKDSLARKGEDQVSKGKIVLATVHGDIHDIGKNIVKTLLENYGFTVLDLGRDVPAEKVVEAVKANGIRLVGLSALMTTTLSAMEETIQALHQLDNPPKIMVGGAVLTKEAAKAMQADFYAKDARESVRYAQHVFEGGPNPDGRIE